MRNPSSRGSDHPDGHQRGVGHRQKVFDGAERMIRQGNRTQANYRKSETLPMCLTHREVRGHGWNGCLVEDAVRARERVHDALS